MSRWGIAGLAVVLLIVLRGHAFTLPLETDECNYAYIGARLLAGDRLYVDVWDHQPPGVFALFAVVTAVFGQWDVVFRGMATVCSVATLVLVYVVARRGAGDWPAYFAAIAFAICSSDPGTAGEGCNREIYMNMLVAAAVAALTSRGHLTRGHLLAGGALLGLGSLLKTVVAAQWLTLTIWVVARAWRDERRSKRLVETVAWLSVGPAIIWVLTLAYFAATGRGPALAEAVFQYNVGYSGLGEGLGGRFVSFFRPFIAVFFTAKPLWVAGAVAIPVLVWLKRRDLAKPVGAWLAYALGSYLAVALPGQFWPHYYYLMVPPLILLCAAFIAEGLSVPRLTEPRPSGSGSFRGSDALSSGVSRRTPMFLRRAVAVVAAAWLVVLFGYQYVYYWGKDPLHIAEHRYDYRMQWARAQGERVGRLTDADDTVFVWGHDVGVYYYAQRRCASRFTMAGPLAESAYGHEERRRVLLEELQTRRPRLVLLVEPEFEELRRFLQANYVKAGLDMDDDEPDVPIMLALMDRTRPVEIVDWEWRAPRQRK